MSTIIESYLREVAASLRVDAARKRQIVDELRTHLTEQVEDRQREDLGRPREDVERDVLRDFGEPRDLALAYEPEGTAVLRNAAGVIVLRVGQAAAAAGRGAGTVLKWTAVALAVLLVVSLGVGAWAYYEVKPYIPSIIESSEPAYEYSERCGQSPCTGAPPPGTFYVRPDARTVRFDLELHAARTPAWNEETGNRTVQVTITDPANATRFDRTFDLATRTSVHHEWSWAAVEGNWTVAYRFDGFVGAIDLHAHALAFPVVDGR